MSIGRKKRRLRRTVAWGVCILFIGWCFPAPSVAVEPKGITGITPGPSGQLKTTARAEAERVGVWQVDHLRASHDRVRISNRRFRLAAATAQEEARAQGMHILYGSEEVVLNGKRLIRGVDYVIDYNEKIISFTDEVDDLALIEVKYRWVPKPEGSALSSGISGIAGISGEGGPVVGIGRGVSSVGLTSGSTSITSDFKARAEFRPGEGTPDVRATLLGTNKPISLGRDTCLELTLTSSREEKREEDPALRRQRALIMPSSRMALTRETRSRQLGATRGMEPEPQSQPLLSGEGYRAHLQHAGKSVQIEATLGTLGRDFDASMADQFASELSGMNQHYRGFKTTEWALRDAAEKKRFLWEKKAVTGRENGKSITREHWKIALGDDRFSYESDQLGIDSEFASNGNLDRELASRFGLSKQKKVGIAAEPKYKAGVSALQGLVDKQETARLVLSGSVKAEGWRRQITDAQGARLVDQNLEIQAGKNLKITHKGEDIDRNFSKFNETGYKNFAGWAGHRHENTQYAWQVNSRLALTHIEDERTINTSGEANQGFKSKTRTEVLDLKLARGQFKASQIVDRQGEQAAWVGGDEVKMTRTRLLELSHQLDRNTNLHLTDQDVLTRQGEQEQKYRQIVSNLTTKFKGVSALSLTHKDERLDGGDKRRTTSVVCNTELGLTATYDQIHATNAPTKSRMLLKYGRKLADGLVLTAAHRRVKNWTEPNWKNENPHLNRLVALQDQEKPSAQGTDLTLSFTPQEGTKATLWHKILQVEGEGKAKAVGLNLAHQLTDRLALTASTDRWGTTETLAGFNQSYGLKFAFAGDPQPEAEGQHSSGPVGGLEVGYMRAQAADHPAQPSWFTKMSLQTSSGLTLSGDYFNRDRKTMGQSDTVNWTLTQKWADDGSISASHTRNPLAKGKIVPTAKTRYCLTAPSSWLKGKGALMVAYETQEASVDGGALSVAPYNAWGAPFKGSDLTKTEASLALQPSKHENLVLTYGRLHGYGPSFNGRQGQTRYDFNYTREFDADNQISVKGFLANADGSWNQPDFERYRVDLEYRTQF